MYAPPRDLAEADLSALVSRSWSLRVDRLVYLPVGFGSHHWDLRTAQGRRLFLTLDLLDPSDPDGHAERLRSALTTAALLAGGPLPQAVAPVRTTDGAVLARAPSYAVSLFPFLEDAQEVTALELATGPAREERLDLLCRLHDATGLVRATVRPDDLAVLGRAGLERALARLDEPWGTGPYAEGARELLRSRSGDLGAALEAYDARASRVRRGAAGWVVTHGEPHAANLLRVRGELVLVDWDTARLAPAARDLWMADTGHGEVAEYRARTGRPVPEEELELYRVHWELSEIALYATDLSRPHVADANTAVAWRELRRFLTEGGRWLSA
ncbi:MAG TPA: phosphotransferase [Ornithinicoccus sp.]|nr:phosphotransferase [Ornithinicoccus sp.]